MDANTEIDLDALQSAIKADIAVAFPSFATVEFDDEHRQGMPLPACLLELCEWQHFDDPDPGTGQQPVMGRFEARFVIPGVQSKTSKRTMKKLAFAFSAFLYLRKWTDEANPGKKLPTGPAEFLGAYPDDFSPELDQFTVWRVEWQQILHAGASVWAPSADDPPTPTNVDARANGEPYTHIAP